MINMKINSGWLRRRFLEAKFGHTGYLAFLVSTGTFIVVMYNLTIKDIPILSGFFPSLWVFATIGLLIYIPMIIGLGHWHIRKQLPIENIRIFEKNPLYAKIARIQIQLLSGTAKETDVQEVIDKLESIEKNQ